MTYSFDSLYQEYISEIQETQPDSLPTVNDFVSDTMATICLYLENDKELDDELQFMLDYINANQLLPK